MMTDNRIKARMTALPGFGISVPGSGVLDRKVSIGRAVVETGIHFFDVIEERVHRPTVLEFALRTGLHRPAVETLCKPMGSIEVRAVDGGEPVLR